MTRDAPINMAWTNYRYDSTTGITQERNTWAIGKPWEGMDLLLYLLGRQRIINEMQARVIWNTETFIYF